MSYGGYSGGFRVDGDVPMRMNSNPTAMEALESAVALPGEYTRAEMHRTLRRNHQDVMKAALQLREKNAFRKQFHYDELNIGLNTVQIELKKGYVHLLENASDMRNCPMLLMLLKHFKPCFSSDKMQLKGTGSMDGTSSLEDTRRLCVYMMDLAVEVMEENKAEGIVFIVDLNDCALGNLEAKMVTDILQMMKMWYPEVVQNVLVINGTTFTRGITHVLTKFASERTQQRIRILQHVEELRNFINPQCIPQLYGGMYRLMTPLEWMKLQADIEQVDLESQAPAKEEQKYMTKDARLLNGMQYAACSVDQVVEMKTSVIRGPIYRNKSGIAWVKLYAILRPEALLIYEQVTSKMPQIIIPVNNEVSVVAAQFADAPRGTFGFRMDVPGVAGGHLLAACSEHERGNWLQEIQMGIDAIKEEVAHERYEEERRAREERKFAALNMISFDDPQPVAPPQQLAQAAPHAQPQQMFAPPPPQVFGGNIMNAPPMSQQQQPMPMGQMGMGFPPGKGPMLGVNTGPQYPNMMAQQVRSPQPATGPVGLPGMAHAGMAVGMNMGMMSAPAAGGYPVQNTGMYAQQQTHPQQYGGQAYQQGYNPNAYRG